jgi:cell division septum initiation protein DivIVA
MESNIEHLKLLKSRVTRTIDVYNAVVRELDRLQLAHQQLKVENQRLEDQLEVLREELKTAKLAQALNGNSDQDPRQMKLQINNYLREIDRCLALLNRD